MRWVEEGTQQQQPSYKNPSLIFRVNQERSDSGLLDIGLERDDMSKVCAVGKMMSATLCLMHTV